MADEMLLYDSISRAKASGCTVIKLSIVEENTILRAWHEKHGFIHAGTRKYDSSPLPRVIWRKIYNLI